MQKAWPSINIVIIADLQGQQASWKKSSSISQSLSEKIGGKEPRYTW